MAVVSDQGGWMPVSIRPHDSWPLGGDANGSFSHIAHHEVRTIDLEHDAMLGAVERDMGDRRHQAAMGSARLNGLSSTS